MGRNIASHTVVSAISTFDTASTNVLVLRLYTTIHPLSVDFCDDVPVCVVIPFTIALNSITSSTYPGSCVDGTFPDVSSVAIPLGCPMLALMAAIAVVAAESSFLSAAAIIPAFSSVTMGIGRRIGVTPPSRFRMLKLIVAPFPVEVISMVSPISNPSLSSPSNSLSRSPMPSTLLLRSLTSV